jgi:tetratricopeptide (TPR) repeat protein
VAALLKDLPDDEDVLFLKSGYLAQTGDLRGAIDSLDAILKNDSRNGSAYLQRGLLFVLTFAQDKACDDFTKALRHLPDDEIAKRQQALLQMGLVQLKHYNDIKKAEKLFKKGIDLDPNSIFVTQLRERIY